MKQSESRFVSRAPSVVAQQTGPVKLRFVEQAKGSILEISINYERAEVPDRRYYADFCDVVEARSSLSLGFGRLSPGQNILRTKIEISFPRDLFINQLWRSSRNLHRLLLDDTKMVRLPPINVSEDTDKIQGFRANNVFVAMLGEDAVMDFYYIAPPDIHFVRSGKRSDVHLEPIVRVALSKVLLLDFLDQCRPFVGDETMLELGTDHE